MELEPLEVCPYDPSHHIRKSRLQRHLTICSKNHPNSNMKRCHFNASHIVKKVDFEKHLLECPDREAVLGASSDDPDILTPMDALANADPNGWGEGAWGNESAGETYKPIEAMKDRAIPHAKIALSKAQRREHRHQERRRCNEVINKEQVKTGNRRSV
ncbi:gametocyte-specific factor 1-like [Phymastichus coffea]|uniref:gametocyte-specific factor 1-like n=1 Tax=Phymastichus coffea TaxID=108790 RepID=UPI00273C1705|nr:gametocyte-specific factor 1-like [Phymastichus coffea]XP_058801708.1 gametocyte-specific factor 1-like [Phymastichus coffea]